MNLVCAGCGNNFIFDRKKKFCSPNCCRTKYRRDLGIAEFKPMAAKICKHCKQEFFRNTSGVYCKPECRLAYSNDRKQKQLQERQQKILDKKLKRKLEAIIRKQDRFNDKHKRSCKLCSKEFIATNFGAPTKYCSDECKQLGTKQNKKEYRKTDSGQKNKRIQKAKRRANTRKQCDPIDPLDVFSRDGWKCKLCDVDTPKELRGSYDDCAPELDHIVPLSRGGLHIISNVRCLCRSCNGIKGNKLDNEINGLGGLVTVKDLSATSAGRSAFSVYEK